MARPGVQSVSCAPHRPVRPRAVRVIACAAHTAAWPHPARAALALPCSLQIRAVRAAGRALALGWDLVRAARLTQRSPAAGAHGSTIRNRILLLTTPQLSCHTVGTHTPHTPHRTAPLCHTQTLNNGLRERGTMTEPPPSVEYSAQCTQWEIFDGYIYICYMYTSRASSSPCLCP